MDQDYLHQLLDAYFDGRLEDEAHKELEYELRSSREARVIFWQRARMEEGVRSHFASDLAQERVWERPDSRRTSPRVWLWPGLAAAAVVMLACGLWMTMKQRPTTAATVVVPVEQEGEGEAGGFLATETQQTHPQSRSDSALAVVERAANASWGGATGPVQSQPLTNAPLTLQSGLVAIDLFSGTRVTIEGPARFTPASENAMEVQSGHLQIEVPAVARGFRLTVRDVSFVSAGGGAFEVFADGNRTEIYSHRGEVEITSRNRSEPVKLTERHAATLIGTDDRIDVRPERSDRTMVALEHRIGEITSGKLANWRESVTRREQDPALLLYFPLDSPRDEARSSLENRALHPQSEREAPVIAAKWVDGRWPGKRALLFRNISDRVRVGVKGTYPQATFAAWVRFDRPENFYNALFFSEWNLHGEAHWQVSKELGFRFSVGSVRNQNGGFSVNFHRAFTDSIFPPAHTGAWTHLATTYDATARQVIHYVNGAEFARTTLERSIPLQFGAATIGNCSSPPPDLWGNRPLGGAIDEFLLYSRALDPKEIASLYESGRPE